MIEVTITRAVPIALASDYASKRWVLVTILLMIPLGFASCGVGCSSERACEMAEVEP